MSAPQQPGPQPQYQQVPQGYELKKKKPIYKKIWFWLLVILAVIIIAAVAGGGGSSDDGVSGEGTNGGNSGSSESSGPDFQGKQDGDLSAEPGQTITMDDVATTASPLTVADSFGTPVLCSSVTIVNNGDDAASFNGGFDWKLQDPAGAARTTTFGGSENLLDSGELAPGGTVSGDVCFEGADAPGQFALIYEPTFSFSSDRAVWVSNR